MPDNRSGSTLIQPQNQRQNSARTGTGPEYSKPEDDEELEELPEWDEVSTKDRGLFNWRWGVRACVFIVAVAGIVTYFMRPKAPYQNLVSPQQELVAYEPIISSGAELADRVLKSYALGFVLEHTEDSMRNVNALEAVRSWGQQQFQKDPHFLYPTYVPPKHEPNDSFLGALGYNLFAPVKYPLEAMVGEFLKQRIAAYHYTEACKSFQNAYFGMFGDTNDSATMLALYQTEKAKLAIDILIWSCIWGGTLAVCGYRIVACDKRKRTRRMQKALSTIWILAGIGYVAQAWMEVGNDTPNLISGIVAILIGCYILKPVRLLKRDDSSLKVRFVKMSFGWTAFAVWMTYSIFAITVLTWIRTTVVGHSDPISLLLASLTGDFIHSPDNGKRILTRFIGFLWLAVSAWAFMQRTSGVQADDRMDTELAKL